MRSQTTSGVGLASAGGGVRPRGSSLQQSSRVGRTILPKSSAVGCGSAGLDNGRLSRLRAGRATFQEFGRCEYSPQ